jgi:hypothetical protein
LWVSAAGGVVVVGVVVVGAVVVGAVVVGAVVVGPVGAQATKAGNTSTRARQTLPSSTSSLLVFTNITSFDILGFHSSQSRISSHDITSPLFSVKPLPTYEAYHPLSVTLVYFIN